MTSKTTKQSQPTTDLLQTYFKKIHQSVSLNIRVGQEQDTFQTQIQTILNQHS
ncbi:hypothetical protein NIES4071_26680 [Calothrix sp. NIES-4071]|nr:hypothetical protein NIES4071_26680 [Calothrix sp. NIES-4071]BAZ56990.1 hypothetical protein NIES4105_26620 [Calothrix sp. NIES-4105]